MPFKHKNRQWTFEERHFEIEMYTLIQKLTPVKLLRRSEWWNVIFIWVLAISVVMSFDHSPPLFIMPCFDFFLPVSKWCWCGPAATPSKRATSCSPRLRCSSGHAACCRSWWTSPYCYRFITTAATHRNRSHTPPHTPPVPKPSERPRKLSGDSWGSPYRGTVDMCKHAWVPLHLEIMLAAHSHLYVYMKTHTNP